ncbi:MAG: hypothetical protein ACPGQL_04695 [Thermoplasmatota archaeon]
MGEMAQWDQWSQVYGLDAQADKSTSAGPTPKRIRCDDHVVETPTKTPAEAQSPAAGSGVVFHNRRTFWFKTAYLSVVTVAFIPVLFWKHDLAATVYVAALAAIHLVSLAVFAVGVKRHHIAPTTRGFVSRIIGLVAATGLLYLASKGLQTEAGSAIFWGSLVAIWVVHTAALALLHIRGAREEAACPFV